MNFASVATACLGIRSAEAFRKIVSSARELAERKPEQPIEFAVHSHVHALGQCRNIIRRHHLKPVVASDTAGSAREVTVELDEGETRALFGEALAAYRTRAEEILLTALTQVFGEWTGGAALLLDVEGRGGEEPTRRRARHCIRSTAREPR